MLYKNVILAAFNQKYYNMLLLDAVRLSPTDYVAFTFFIGFMAMFAATVFFFAEMRSVDKKWRMSLLVSALITGIAAVHYYYMRDYYLAFGENPTFYRYVAVSYTHLTLPTTR